MPAQPPKPAEQNAADIAREAFHRLAAQRIAPTPDAYRAVYDEIAGLPAQTDAETILSELAARLAASPGAVAELGRQCVQASAEGNWQDCGEQLIQLLEQHLAPAAASHRRCARADGDPAAIGHPHRRPGQPAARHAGALAQSGADARNCSTPRT